MNLLPERFTSYGLDVHVMTNAGGWNDLRGLEIPAAALRSDIETAHNTLSGVMQ